MSHIGRGEDWAKRVDFILSTSTMLETINNPPPAMPRHEYLLSRYFQVLPPFLLGGPARFPRMVNCLFQEGVEHPNRECRILEADHCQHPANGNLDQLLVREQVPCNFCRRGCGVGWPKT